MTEQYIDSVNQEYLKITNLNFDQQFVAYSDDKRNIETELNEINYNYKKDVQKLKYLYEKMKKHQRRSINCQKNEPKFLKKFIRFVKSQNEFYRARDIATKRKCDFWNKAYEMYIVEKRITCLLQKKLDIYSDIQTLFKKLEESLNSVVPSPTKKRSFDGPSAFTRSKTARSTLQ